jgi:hypothetical protein
MADCTGLKEGDNVLIDNEKVGIVVKVHSKYFEVQVTLPYPTIKKFARQTGYMWGETRGFGGYRTSAQPYNEEKHKAAVSRFNLMTARKDITYDVQRNAPSLSIDQVERIRAILSEVDK